MKRILTVLSIALIMLSSCISYTVEMGYSRISLPDESGPKKETRYRLIQEGGGYAPGSLPDAIQQYPEDLSGMTYPYLYAPYPTCSLKDSGITEISILTVPLGHEELTAEETAAILSSLSDIDADFIVITGSLENQVTAAEKAGKNAVTLEGGTVLFSLEYVSSNGKSAIFNVAEGKDAEIAVLSFDNEMPSSPADIPQWTAEIEKSGNSARTKITADSMTDPESILIISSSEPSTLDWTMLTLRYRGEKNFPISDMMLSSGWTDAYRATHFSPETDAGITRVNGSIHERMDFIYTKGVMPSWTIAFPVKGLTDTKGISALLADIIIP